MKGALKIDSISRKRTRTKQNVTQETNETVNTDQLFSART